MYEIKYKPEFFEILNELSIINEKIMIESKDDKTIVFRKKEDGSIEYNLKVSKDYFDTGEYDKYAFYRYSDFYKFFKCLTVPKIYRDNNVIVMTDDQTKIEYILNDPNTLSTSGVGRDFSKFPSHDIELPISMKDLETISKMATSFSAKKIRIYGNEHELYLKVIVGTNGQYSNSFERKFEFTNVSNFEGEFDFMILADIFSKMLSKKKNYILHIIRKGFIKIQTVTNNDIELNLYTTKVLNKKGE